MGIALVLGVVGKNDRQVHRPPKPQPRTTQEKWMVNMHHIRLLIGEIGLRLQCDGQRQNEAALVKIGQCGNATDILLGRHFRVILRCKYDDPMPEPPQCNRHVFHGNRNASNEGFVIVREKGNLHRFRLRLSCALRARYESHFRFRTTQPDKRCRIHQDQIL
jgi:hypothetical protein